MVSGTFGNLNVNRNDQHCMPVALTTAVNLSEMKTSNNPAETLVAFSIGSGIGMTIYDPISSVGGLLNFMLPSSTTIESARIKKYPFMFADTGIPAFLSTLEVMGARTERMKVVIAGGARVLNQTGVFNVGRHNYQATRLILSGYKLDIHYEDIGGFHSRTLKLNIGSGTSTIHYPDQRETKI